MLGLNLDSRVIDVGYAGVVGADLILDGTIPYGNMPADVGTGDTYGPLNYLLYVPFVLIFGFSGEWDFLPAAHALTAFAFVGGALAMFITGWRLSGAEGRSSANVGLGSVPLHPLLCQQQHKRPGSCSHLGHRASCSKLAAWARG